MIFNLVVKDALIVKKYILLMFFVAIFAPGLLLSRIEGSEVSKSTAGGLIFFLVLFVIIFLLSSSISMVDETYKKGCAYLCTTPYTRRQIVISKYVFTYIVFIAYVGIYFLESMFLKKYTVDLTAKLVIGSLLFISIFRGVLIPLEYKFGYEKAKYIIMISIMAVPFVSSYVIGNFDFSFMDLSWFYKNENLFGILCIGCIVILNFVSIILSCKIFENKDM